MCSVLTELAHCTQVQKTMKEIWKAVLGYEGYYEVSNMGNVKSVDRVVVNKLGYSSKRKGKIIKLGVNSMGYYVIDLCKYSVRDRRLVHRLVAKHYMENFEAVPNLEVDHIDQNPKNNLIENLRMSTHSQNLINTGLATKMKSKGVTRVDGKWLAKIMKDYKPITIGRFINKADAINAYNLKATELFGEFADNNYLIDRQ